jgi:uncharacterized protein YfeS
MSVGQNDKDALSDPSRRHPRARELLPDEKFFDSGSDCAPFGSDEGWEAYQEWRRWRKRNPNANLIDCIGWILRDRFDCYTEQLLGDERIARAAGDDGAQEPGLEGWNAFTLDATIMATALGQLLDEGHIDAEARPCARVAVERQLHPMILATWGEHEAERERLMQAVRKVIDLA